ncbi:hypothetical protein R69927_02196 [Paraburkholderia domus]|jgi:hypothetical protein|uniref:DUF4148 domain-containing protein n=1 Tax=Paraburkholderia domus TaxID=2793075 RepID=A0A9N8QYD0_9BURK|nr:DUF4148 domain-containing protein [Paraburkholderia domus]MBK5050053.1 DUF4148 domain-containing protein [Burkholderia sp. R-70006]MBK5064253.1 DUF4148 domain-containing protein [Burkholderia sp. R-70199]MBK5086788.1 DUF4148 domain-containing protein [Burkholderia sp. R-69927]MBK5121511.1 DUF4148 domain-containing protein [Burkholderia sp. R-69980]MBK5166654.1 DUF4148 domain-containing protein [Burkholderia sp. R-70211]MBK5185336.1 DUF4148 domain-containing protein [Burkholderia sp. R-6974
MKSLTLAIAFIGATATASAFAQSTTAPTQQNATPTMQVAANSTAAVNAAGSWVPPYGQATAGKTRAQVYGELVHAEKDGQLAYLNSTVYAH